MVRKCIYCGEKNNHFVVFYCKKCGDFMDTTHNMSDATILKELALNNKITEKQFITARDNFVENKIKSFGI